MSVTTPGIARFLRPSGGVVGGGALLEGQLVVTCAHVVNATLDRSPLTPDPPEGLSVSIDFPLQGVGPVAGEVVAWSSPGVLGEGDIALLRLDTSPVGVLPVPRTTRVPASLEQLEVFGFPAGRPDGVWKNRIVRAGSMVGGWSQVNGEGSYRLQRGFSGCPLLTSGHEAVGIIAQSEENPEIDAAAYIPIGVAAAALGPDGEALLPAVRDGTDPESAVMDATAAFVGCTRSGPTHPCLVTSWQEFLKLFGEPLRPDDSCLGDSLRGFFANGGEVAWVVRVSSPGAARAAVTIPTASPKQSLIAAARSEGAWGNGVRVTIDEGARQGVRLSIEAAVESREEGSEGWTTLEQYDNLAADEREPNPILQQATFSLLELRWQQSALPGALPLPGVWRLSGGADGPQAAARDYIGEHGRGIAALESLGHVGIVCVPDADLPRLSLGDRTTIVRALVDAAERMKAVALVGCGPETDDVGEVRALVDSAAAAMFFPNVVASRAGELSRAVTPVGHIAGALARSDRRFGIQASPQGIAIYASPSLAVTVAERDLLERRGINVLLPRSGRRAELGSAQTTAIEEQRRPLNVVRTMFMIERSIREGLAWTTYAANDEQSWTEVRSQIETYLHELWRRGVIAGESPEEAFFVVCDETTMTSADGRLIPVVGFVPANVSVAGASIASAPPVLEARPHGDPASDPQ
jgi:phage tail sheath protein FI